MMDDAELLRQLRETDPWDSPSVAAECLAEAADRIEAMAAQIELWRRNRRETFDAMCAMRDSINEHIPMPSLESDLLQGPEDSVFCATVAEAVINHVSAHAALIAERDAARDAALEEAAKVAEKERRFWDRGYNTSSGGFLVCNAAARIRDAIRALKGKSHEWHQLHR